MTACAVIAASVVAANAGTAKAGSAVLTAIFTAAASFAGAALAAWMSLRIAGQRMQHERRQEAVKRAFDSAGSHMSAPDLAARVPNRPEIINRMYKAFSDPFELGNWNGEEANKDLAVARMMSLLKETLGIEQFGLLRQMTLDSALYELSESENGKKHSTPIAAWKTRHE